MQKSFKSGFWNAKKKGFWITICLECLILRTCECKALSECDSCVRILEMRAEAMHGSLSAAGTKYYVVVRKSCSWLGRLLQCLWTRVVQITNPIRKLIMIRNSCRNVVRSFVNRPYDFSWPALRFRTRSHEVTCCEQMACTPLKSWPHAQIWLTHLYTVMQSWCSDHGECTYTA